MKQVLLAAVAAMAFAGGAVQASPLDDAKSAMTALDKGDNSTAVRLFTSALKSGRLTRADQELAFVKRGEAYLASSDNRAALADANRALDIDPHDVEAVATRDRAHALLNPPAPPKPATDTGQSAMARYDAAMAKYEAEKKADADSYAQEIATHDAAVRAQQTKHETELAAWRADVQACKSGDLSKCANGDATTAQVAQATAKPSPAPKADKQMTAKVAAKPQVKKPGVLPPLERPAIY